MTDLAKLVVSLEAQNQKYLAKLEQSEKRAKRWQKRTQKSVSGVKNAFAALGSALAIRDLSRRINEQRKLIDSQAKFADVIGLTTEEFAGYQLGAQISGVALGQLNTGLQRFLKNVGDAGDGLAAPTRSLAKLGLSFEDLKNLTTDEQLKLVAERFRGLDNSVDKANVSLNLFGRSGINISKLLETGASGIDRFKTEAEGLGLAISRIDAAKVEEANDSLTRAGSVVDGFFRRVSVELSPAIDEMANKFIDAAASSEGFGDRASQVALAVTRTFDGALFVINGIVKSFEAVDRLAQKIASIVTGTSAGFSTKDLKKQVAELKKERDALASRTPKGIARTGGNSAIKALDAQIAEKQKFIDLRASFAPPKANDKSAGVSPAIISAAPAGSEKFQNLLQNTDAASASLDIFKETLDKINSAAGALTSETVKFQDVDRFTAEARFAQSQGKNDKAVGLAAEGAKALQLLKEQGGASTLQLRGALKELDRIAAKASAPSKDKGEPPVAKGELKIEIRGNSYSFKGTDKEIEGFTAKAIQDALKFEIAGANG